jgi:hypothetical protein
MRNVCKMLTQKLKGRDHYGDVDVFGVILKWILEGRA